MHTVLLCAHCTVKVVQQNANKMLTWQDDDDHNDVDDNCSRSSSWISENDQLNSVSENLLGLLFRVDLAQVQTTIELLYGTRRSAVALVPFLFVAVRWA